MANFELTGGDLVYTDGEIGAWFCPEDENWYPFRYFEDTGVMDVASNEYMMLKPSSAYSIAKMLFT